MDVMRADPSEQIMMIKRAASEASLDFDKLNIGYKRLLAEYFGGDIKKAAAFFKADLLEAQSMMNSAAASEKELEERKKQSATAQEKINALLDNMKIAFMPLVELASSVAESIGSILKFPGGPILATLSLIGIAFGALQFAIYRIKVAAIEVAGTFTGTTAKMSSDIALVAAEIASLNANLFGTAEAATVAAARVATLRAEQASAGLTGGLTGTGPTVGAGGGAAGMSGAAKAGSVAAIVAIVAGGIALANKAESIKENQEITKKQYEEYKKNEYVGINPFTGDMPASPVKGNGILAYITKEGGKKRVEAVPVDANKSDKLLPNSVGGSNVVGMLKMPGDGIDKIDQESKSPYMAGAAPSSAQASAQFRETINTVTEQKIVSSTQFAKEIKPVVYANLTIGRKQLGALGVEVAPTVAGQLNSKESDYA
jgi:hypothetical protein